MLRHLVQAPVARMGGEAFMKVGIDVSSLTMESQRTRGIGRYTKNLVQHLKGDTPKFRYTFFSHGLLRAPVEVGEGCRPRTGRKSFLHRYPVGLGGSFLVNQVVLPLRLVAGREDLIHFPTHLGAPLSSSRVAIVTVHDLIQHVFPQQYLKGFQSRLYMRCAAMAAKRAAAIITISEASKRDIVRFYGVEPERIAVIPHGIEPLFAPRDRRQASDEIKRRYGVSRGFLLYVGGFDYRKNLLGLVEAFGELKRRHVFAGALVIVGRRPPAREPVFRRLLATIESKALQRDVVFVDYVADSDLPLFYSAADALGFPSLYEGFGFPLLEAMACGTPVIAFNHSSIPEVVGTAGILLDQTDTETFAAAIAEVLTNSALRDDLRARGLQRAREFTWARTAELTLGVYRRVVDEP